MVAGPEPLTARIVRALTKRGHARPAQLAADVGAPVRDVAGRLSRCAARGTYGIRKEPSGEWTAAGALTAGESCPWGQSGPRTRQWRVAFALAALSPARPAQVAEALGMDPQQVRSALHYCASRGLHGVRRHPSGMWMADGPADAWTACVPDAGSDHSDP